MEYMSKNVDVDELLFGGLFTLVQDGTLVIATQPDWVRNPNTGLRNYISDMWISEIEGKCPECGEMTKPGIITFKDTDEFVIACPKCKNFIWAKVSSEPPNIPK